MRTIKILIAVVFWQIAFTLPSFSQERHAVQMSVPENMFATLKKVHPRLMATAEDFEAAKARIASDAKMKAWFEEIKKSGDKILTESPSKYEIPDGLRLLSTSRRVVGRIYTLGFLYKMTNDSKYAERAWEELLAASQFPDWNPKHFLDVGEMTLAFGIGYDWFFDYWNVDRKNIIKSAIIEKGLGRALLAYEGISVPNHGWWVNVSHNWNQVCNGGIGVGALAIADEEPKLSEAILRNVIKHLPAAMVEFGPDGAWNEGPGYWGYATKYNVSVIASMFTALGTDFGLSNIDGFSKTVLFPLYLTGPFNKSFNYADGGDGAAGGSQMYWFARRFNIPAAAHYQLKLVDNPGVFDILWYPEELLKQNAADLPFGAYYRSAEVVTMRSAWNDEKAWFVGFKAGDNKANHSNLDLGSFILDAYGKRFILDLGADNYNMPGYFSTGKTGKRWSYYRMRAEGHNTLVLNPGQNADQDPTAATAITRFSTLGKTTFAIADLTPAYAENAKSVQRGIAMIDGNTVVINDELQTPKPATAYWFVHTRANAKLTNGGKKALLTMDNDQIEVEIIAPSKARFTVMPARPLDGCPNPEMQNKNEGISKLSIALNKISNEKIVVAIHPVNTKTPDASRFYKALSQWKIN